MTIVNHRGRLKVPILHYVSFWVGNTLLSVGTGFLMGLMAFRACTFLFAAVPFTSSLLFVLIIFTLGFFLVYQYILTSFFFGKRRGEFEYSFLKKSAESGKLNHEVGVRLKEIKQELRLGGPNSGHLKLASAIEAFPDNFVVHFEYAISCERMGLAEDAIAAYEDARKLLPNSSQALNIYIEKQITRVKTKGPSNRSAAPGLQYILY